MMLRACALTNQGKLREASRLFGRLCVLLPDNTICEAYYRMTRDGEAPDDRLSLGLDVTRREGMARAMELIAALYRDPAEMRRTGHRRERFAASAHGRSVRPWQGRRWRPPPCC